MREVKAVKINAADFAPYGTFYSMTEPEGHPLEGDHYFHIHREGHNLDRCRTQLTLVKDMQEKLPQMNAIIQKYK